MNTTDKAINFFRAGYSCSQSVLMACAGESDSASRTAAAFGKRCGRSAFATPHHVTHDMLMREVARQKGLPVFLPRLPVWLLRAVMGEMSVLLTTGSRISSERLSAAGFQFSYPDISSALRAC